MVVIQEIIEPRCHALNLSDEQRCTAQATTNDGLFCKFHAKQCFGLYMGYKQRNLALDELAQNEPAYLRNSKVSLATQTFEGIQTQDELQEVHEYLFDQYILLGKVISARKLHHKHFYSLEMDYGHKVYLDKLVSTRHSVLCALENIEKRTAELLYDKEKWYGWVREVQDSEEKNREKEQKKVKLEAALFRRNKHEIEARLAAARKKEEKKRQEAYLEGVWRERVASESGSGSALEDNGSAWDPIEDVFDDDRGRYNDLIRHFLWIEPPELDPEAENPADPSSAGSVGGEATGKPAHGSDVSVAAADVAKGQVSEGNGNDNANDGEATAVQKKKVGKRGGKKKKMKALECPPGLTPEQYKKFKALLEPDKNRIESKEDIRKRLKEGVEKDYSHVSGPMMVGTAQNPAELYERTAAVKEEEIEQLISDISEIKELLFCRQVMRRSALLPAALRANSVEEFLADPSVSESDLRDLCLEVEIPSLQALRDACADFLRGDEPDDDDDEDDKQGKFSSAAEYIRHHFRYSKLEHNFYEGLSSISRRALRGSDEILEDIADDDNEHKDKKMKVRICGRNIWNHASQRSMARNGWLHFSIMAKDCQFPDAIALCRNWDEFFELNVLAMWQYFPASRWTGWTGNFWVEELMQMGFVPFHMDLSAHYQTTYNQLPSTSRKVIRRQSELVEARNYVCAYMKRNDPSTRRFIQYAMMRPGDHLILVRDGKTGRIITAPQDEHLWIARSRQGGIGFRVGQTMAHSGDDGWMIELAVDADFFDIAQEECEWEVNFTDCYEIYIWDFAPGNKATKMYHFIKECLSKAMRIRGNRDKFRHLKPILQTLMRESDTKRVRQIRPGEDVKSLYDELSGPNAQFWIRTTDGKMINTSEEVAPGMSPYLYYNDTDAAEDAILFEEELEGVPQNMPFVEITNPVQQLEASRMPLSLLNHTTGKLLDSMPPELERMLGLNKKEAAQDEDKANNPYVPGSEEFPFKAPPIWEQFHTPIAEGSFGPDRAKLLETLDFSSVRLRINMEELKDMASSQEIMERDRAYIFKDTFHLGDLEPGAQERHKESMKLIIGQQKYQSPHPEKHKDWAWFCMEVLDWINLKIHYADYVKDPMNPWPHRYILQDIVQAFMTMGLFFPTVEVTSIIQEYLTSDEGKAFKDSKIFDCASRGAVRPDIRSRVSCAYRPKSFWHTWDKEVYTGDNLYIDSFPWDWNMAIRPIIAKLYRAGMIGPACVEPHPDVVPGFATANTEEHRPEKLDLFIQFSNTDQFKRNLPPSFIDYKDWPELLPAARKFAAACKKTPRFALLRLWSAPHFYPLMMLLPMRRTASFLDPVGRAWEWKFIPKDLPMSEWSVHNTTMLRLGYLREQMMGLGPDFKTPIDKSRGRIWADPKYSAQDKFRHGHSEFDGRVLHRGDLILVMGEDEADLLKWCTAVTFAMQTKPWLREIDLWKSFINVDLDFLESLNEYWLD
ncbi:hypothetical protein QBC35DRAFT_385541 [Podospora australis]|uniref:Uncharacterized protein n=1 Tax=Podospora australis TaxID=1536484 RepID=A0AAN6WSH7_9PEZI|nr:hypothetical protein QBC35DRAFT_385541 [Podospora australis]